MMAGVAVGAPRLDDTGRSGWWQAAAYLPGALVLLGGSVVVIGVMTMPVPLIVEPAQPGEAVANAYRPPPAFG